MQVVTNENMAEFIQNRSVPDFVPPKADVKVEVKAEVKADEPAKEGEQPRGADGQFVKADKVDEVAADAAAKAEKSAVDDEGDPDGEGLTEHARRVIGKKHRRMKEAEEFARQLYGDKTAAEKRAEEAERKLAERDPKSRPDSDKDSKEPKAEDFKTVGEYAEALAEYKVEKKFAEREAKRDQEQREQAAQRAQAELNGAITKVAKEIPDYADVIGDSEIDMPPHITVYLATNGETGVRLGYHLAKHPDEYDRIAKLSPIRAIAELGKLEDRITKPKEKAKEPDPEVQAVSRAPSPITPLEGNNAVVQKDPAKMTIQELRVYEQQQRAAKARR